MEQTRIDKWLWAARFCKTRSLASEEIVKGRIQVNAQVVKPSREIKVGDTVAVRHGPLIQTVIVLGISSLRGPASVAQQLYAETVESVRQREQLTQQLRTASEPAMTIEHGRPTKRDRRDMEKVRRTR
ncbi:MAG: RNA-binding S4 domain-containing protein [Comamonadaceae bacterium]